MHVRFLDLRVQDDDERESLLTAVDTVLRHGRIVMGPELEELETQIAGQCGRKFGVGASSGTGALFLALKSLGIGPGDEVITTSLSWIATANAIAVCGATPVFADIADDLNLDPASVARLVTPQTKAILVVHWTGRICQMDPLLELCQSDVSLVEDASQAFSARLHDRPAGAFGKLACFSMNPMKVYAALGEAGMVVGDDEGLRERLEMFRYNGTVNRETCIEPSLNGRPDTLQAAMLLKRLPLVERVIGRRREIAQRYNSELAPLVTVPIENEGEHHVYYTYTLQTDRRDELKSYLEAAEIETKIHHPILMPEQPAYRDGVRGEFSNAKKLIQQILCIPCHEKMSDEQVSYVIEKVKQFYHG